MRPDMLQEAIEADLAAGLAPFCVVSNIGSVATGIIDPMQAIAQVCAEYGLWHHGDGAYGGFGAVVPSLAPLYAGFEGLDSLTIDPHKMLCLPIGCGAALIRRCSVLRETFSIKPSYLATNAHEEPWLHEFTFELTRPFQALGKNGVRLLVERYLRLARHLAGLVQATLEELELISAGPLSVVCFRYAPPALRDDEEGLNALNSALIELLQTSGTTFITGVQLEDGKCALRACVCNYLTTEQDVEELVWATRSSGQDLVTHPVTR